MKAKRMGRPKAPRGTALHASITVRLTKGQLRELDAAARGAGLTRSAFVIRKIGAVLAVQKRAAGG